MTYQFLAGILSAVGVILLFLALRAAKRRYVDEPRRELRLWRKFVDEEIRWISRAISTFAAARDRNEKSDCAKLK